MAEMDKLVSDQDMIMKADLEALLINIISTIDDFNIIKNNQEIIQSDKIEELNTLVDDLNYLININLMNVRKFTNEFKIINDKLIELNNKLNVTEKSITNYYNLTTKLSGNINTFYPVIFNIFNKEGSVFIERNGNLDIDIFPYNTPLLSTEIHYSHNSGYPMFFNIERNIQRYKKTIRLISDKVFSATQENINDLSLWKFYPEINNTENPAEYYSSFYIRGGLTYTFRTTDETILNNIVNSINRIGSNESEHTILNKYTVKQIPENKIAYIKDPDLYQLHKRYGNYSSSPNIHQPNFDEFIQIEDGTTKKPIIYSPINNTTTTELNIFILSSRPEFIDTGDSLDQIKIIESLSIDFTNPEETIIDSNNFTIDGNGYINFTYISKLQPTGLLYFIIAYHGIVYGWTLFSDPIILNTDI